MAATAAGAEFQTTASRTFLDFNGNHVPDCDMLNPQPNGECIAPDLGNFANTNAFTQVNPAVLSGWGVRPYDWQFGVSVQQEILPRTSLEVGYARRWFSNFFVNDNINLSPSDFSLVSVTAPRNDKLPDGGGYPMQYYVPKPGVSTTNIQNSYTFASDYGDWTQLLAGRGHHRERAAAGGLVLQIGSSTGRGVTDNCEVVAKVPEMLNPALTNPSPFTANTYSRRIPATRSSRGRRRCGVSCPTPCRKIDVLVSGIFRFAAELDRSALAQRRKGTAPGCRRIYATTVNGQPANVNLLQPGQVLRRSRQPDRHAVRQDPAIRPQEGQHRHRRPEPVQLEHRHGVSAELRRWLRPI